MRTFSILILLICAVGLKGNSQTWGDSTIKTQPVFSSVEIAPKFPGGLNGYYKFLSENLNMPKDRFSTFSFKTVVARIYLDITGKIVFVEIEKGVNENYNNEVIELIKKMPVWSPGLQNGRPVPLKISIPVLFVD